MREKYYSLSWTKLNLCLKKVKKKKKRHRSEFANMLSSGKTWSVTLYLVGIELAHRLYKFECLQTIMLHTMIEFWLLLRQSEKLCTKDLWFITAITGWNWATEYLLEKARDPVFSICCADCHPRNGICLVPMGTIYMHVSCKASAFLMSYFFHLYNMPNINL